MAFLVETGASPARRITLGERATLGREEGCSLRIDDPLVSPRHAEIRHLPDGRYELVDLGSRRGTFVGDRRVSSHVLSHGEEILVGPARFRFEEGRGLARPRLEGTTGTVMRYDGPVLSPPPGRPVTPSPAGPRDTRSRLRRNSDVAAYAAVELTAALEEAADLQALLEALLRTSIDVVGAERGAVLLIGEGDVTPTLQISRRGDGTPTEVTLSSSLLSEVVARKEGVVTPNALEDPRLHGAMSLVAQAVRSAICVPLMHQGEQLGVLHLDSPVGDAFNEGKLGLATAMARQASVAIRSALLARKVDASARAERERLERLLADLPDGVVLVEDGGRVAFVNPLAPELLAALGAVTGGRIERIGDVTLPELVRRREPLELQLEGPPRRVVVAFARETGGAGAVLLILRDVTREREREARAAQQERLAVMGQLAAGVAHDFNNLLAVIQNFAQFVMDEVEGRQKEDLEQVLEATRRASQLVKQLLAFSRREVTHPETVRLEEALRALDRLLRGAVGERVELSVRAEPALWPVRVDPSMLGQVVLNLVVNARDAMPTGGTLTVALGKRELDEEAAAAAGVPPGRYGAIEVTDTGTGMTEHVAARVFEPFFTTKGKGKGTGLGLATALGIVQQAGGSITLRTRLGEGSTFSVLLPVSDELPGAQGERADDGGRPDATILVAEDEAAVRDLTRRILSEAGYRVIDAGSGPEALELAGRLSERIDLLLTDVVMPRMSGKQLAQRLAEARPGLRTLFMSGYFELANDLGSESFLAKPFNRQGLLDRVRAALREPLPTR